MSILPKSAQQYGSALHQLLDAQKSTYPNLDVPYIAWYLVNHIKKLGGIYISKEIACCSNEMLGFHTESIFRVPGSVMEIQSIKSVIETSGFTEELRSCSVHSTAGAFTLWLRSLPSPIVPYFM